MTADPARSGLADVEDRVAAVVAQIGAALVPHRGDEKALWAAMPAAFEAAMGRAPNRADAYDVALCHAALLLIEAGE